MNYLLAASIRGRRRRQGRPGRALTPTLSRGEREAMNPHPNLSRPGGRGCERSKRVRARQGKGLERRRRCCHLLPKIVSNMAQQRSSQ